MTKTRGLFEIMDLREELANLEHERWSHWMEYLFSKCAPTSNDSDLIIPSSLVERWRRQIETPYSELSEKEKDSDRAEADKSLALYLKFQDSNQEIISSNGRFVATIPPSI